MIREMRAAEFVALENFLYEAIYVPAGVAPPPREIIFQPELQVYVKNFGTGRADFAFAAEVGGEIVGAAWSRIMNDYGHIDDETPSLALSVLKKFRRAGLATALTAALLEKLAAEKFRRVSLSVQKENSAALALYKKFGFEIFRATDSEFIMTLDLEWLVVSHELIERNKKVYEALAK